MQEIKEVSFAMERMRNTQTIAPGVYRSHVHRSEVSPDIIISCERYIATMGLDTVVYPETWWDAFKDRWFPVWALNRWPATFRTYTAKALFPKLYEKIPMSHEDIQREFGNFRIAYLGKEH